jgi:hypothetical protein
MNKEVQPRKEWKGKKMSRITNPICIAGTPTRVEWSASSMQNKTICTPPSNPPPYKYMSPHAQATQGNMSRYPLVLELVGAQHAPMQLLKSTNIAGKRGTAPKKEQTLVEQRTQSN